MEFKERKNRQEKIENLIEIDEVSYFSEKNALFFLVEDDEFINLCKSEKQHKLLEYLVGKGILSVEINFPPSKKMAVISPSSSSTALSLLAITDVSPILLWVSRPSKSLEEKEKFCSLDLNYCFKAISLFSSEAFAEKMFQIFLAIENREKIEIKVEE